MGAFATIGGPFALSLRWPASPTGYGQWPRGWWSFTDGGTRGESFTGPALFPLEKSSGSASPLSGQRSLPLPRPRPRPTWTAPAAFLSIFSSPRFTRCGASSPAPARVGYRAPPSGGLCAHIPPQTGASPPPSASGCPGTSSTASLAGSSWGHGRGGSCCPSSGRGGRATSASACGSCGGSGQLTSVTVTAAARFSSTPVSAICGYGGLAASGPPPSLSAGCAGCPPGPTYPPPRCELPATPPSTPRA